MKRILKAADLFCGAGGTSTGLKRACEKLGMELQLHAINHWDVAIATHTANHPNANHLCNDLDAVNPRAVVPGGRLDLLWASPECQHFSVARGAKPVSDQQRSSAWLVLRWAELLYIDTILIENVKEFETWGPVGANGQPMKSRRGETFKAFVAALESLSYKVEWRVLNAADFGAATTRERLFIQARRGRKQITWPEPTHSKMGADTLFGQRSKWKAAREVIDWDTPSKSIFARNKPLSPKTMQRILAGLEKFGGDNIQPFLVILRNHMGAQSVNQPMPTLTAGGTHIGLAQPFITAFRGDHPGKNDGSRRNHSVDEPLRTMDTSPRFGLVEPKPFILGHRQFDEDCVDSIERPLRTITVKGASDMGVVEPFIVPYFGERDGQKPRTHSLDNPLPSVTSHGAGALVTPFLVGAGGAEYAAKPKSVEEPMNTVLTEDHRALVSPFVMSLTHGGRVHDPAEPLPTVTCAHRGELGAVSPYLMKYCSTGGARSVDEPVDTITSKDRFGLVTPLVTEINGERMALDIHFRMLTPKELARAMSFPEGYKFTGNRGDVVKQIGNAVDGNQAEALCRAVLSS